MEHKKRLSKIVTTIHIEPYLAEYAIRKFNHHSETDAVMFPPGSCVYCTVWENMARPRANASTPAQEGNLTIFLPSRRAGIDGGKWKDPAYFNYLSPRAVNEIEAELREVFNLDLRRTILKNEKERRESKEKRIDVVNRFMQQYGLTAITEDALLKNYARYINRMSPQKPRKYRKKLQD